MRQWMNEASLNGSDWTLTCDDGSFAEMPATVPGNIQADAESARQLTPIYYGLGDERIWEIARHDWFYEKQFTISPAWKGKRITLCFDGVDYACEVWLNGKKLGENAGAYIPFTFDITNKVMPGKPQTLRVKVLHMPPELEEWIVNSDGAGSGEGTDYHFVIAMNKTRQLLKGMKSISNFSYDWGVNIWTLGIWKDVRLVASAGAAVVNTGVHSQPEENGNASLRVEWLIDSDKAATAVMQVAIAQPGGGVMLREVPLQLKKGSHSYTWNDVIEAPQLWWPNGQGAQPLYGITSTLVDEKGDAMDGMSTRFGIRRLEWGNPPGLPSDFPNPVRCVINGRLVRLIGSDINSPDLLHGRAHAKGPLLVQRMHAAGMNTIRMNGGAIIFTEAFHDACDELGILQLAEFPLGNCMPETTPEFLAHWEKVVAGIVAETRNHPCIIEWSGGNEMAWRLKDKHPALLIAQRLCDLQDGRIFRATSPSEGVRHAPWDYNPAMHYRHYNSTLMRDQTGEWPMLRDCEFGCQTPASLETFQRTIPPQNRFPVRLDDPVQIRKNTIGASFNDQVWLMPDLIHTLFGEAASLEELIDAGQWMAFEGLRYAFDALRDKPDTLGLTSWCLCEPWYNGAGSFMIEHDGRPLPMYYGAMQASQPISLHLRYDDILYDMIDGMSADIMLTSDAPAWVQSLRWEAVLRDRHGIVYRAQSGTADIYPGQVKTLGQMRIEPPMDVRPGPVLCELTLSGTGGVRLAERLYIFGSKGALNPMRGLLRSDVPDVEFGQPPTFTGVMGGPLAQTTLEATLQAAPAENGMDAVAVTVHNTGSMTAAMVQLHPLLDYRTDLFVDGQYGFVPPGEARTLTVTAQKGTLPLLQTGFRVTAFNAEAVLCQPKGVLLWAGRRDDTTTGFAGCDAPGENLPPQTYMAEGCMLPTAQVNCLLTTGATLEFTLGKADAQKACVLDLFTADRPAKGATLQVKLNKAAQTAKLPAGYGYQKDTPWHWAAPHHLQLQFEAGTLKEGKNTLELTVPANGWVTFDALRLCRELSAAEKRPPADGGAKARVSWGANFL